MVTAQIEEMDGHWVRVIGEESKVKVQSQKVNDRFKKNVKNQSTKIVRKKNIFVNFYFFKKLNVKNSTSLGNN